MIIQQALDHVNAIVKYKCQKFYQHDMSGLWSMRRPWDSPFLKYMSLFEVLVNTFKHKISFFFG